MMSVRRPWELVDDCLTRAVYCTIAAIYIAGGWLGIWLADPEPWVWASWLVFSGLLFLGLVAIGVWTAWEWVVVLWGWWHNRRLPVEAPAVPETYCSCCGVPRSVYERKGHDVECIWFDM